MLYSGPSLLLTTKVSRVHLHGTMTVGTLSLDESGELAEKTTLPSGFAADVTKINSWEPAGVFVVLPPVPKTLQSPRGSDWTP